MPHLSLPFYWDEAWVYGKAARVMAEEGVSLFPNSLQLELGRGHPLLFHATFGLFLKVFGNTIFNAHLLALIISFLTLFTAFSFSEKFFGKWSGVFAVAILLPQPIFLAQSNLVLPEMALTLFVLLSVKLFLEEKMIWYFVAASAAILIKESAIVLFGAISLSIIFRGIRNKTTIVQVSKQIVVALLPLIWWGAHLIFHKVQFGTFLFKEHTDIISLRIEDIANKLERGFFYVFLAQGRNIMFFLALAASLILLFRKSDSAKIKSVIPAMMAFSVLFLVFSSLNYLAERYLLVTIVFITLICAGVLFTVINNVPVRIASMLTCIAASAFWLTKPTMSDHTMGYADAVKAYQNAINFLNENINKTDTVYAYFNLREAMTQPHAGYLKSPESFINVRPEPSTDCRYFIFSNVENGDELEKYSKLHGLQSVKRFETGIAWAEIMKKTGEK